MTIVDLIVRRIVFNFTLRANDYQSMAADGQWSACQQDILYLFELNCTSYT